jgi:hypothetical protein
MFAFPCNMKSFFSPAIASLLAAVCCLVNGPVEAQAPPPGTLLIDFLPPHDYSPTGSGFLQNTRISINDLGQVGGGFWLYENGASTGTRPVRWTYALGYELMSMNTPPSSLGSYSALITGITNSGQMAGQYTVYDSSGASIETRPARWNTGSAAPEDLGHLMPGATNSQVYDINESGTVIGRSYVGALPLGQRPVRWDAGSTTPAELGVLGFDSTGSTSVNALGLWINNAGAATGTVTKYSSTGAYQGWRAVRWDAGSTTAVELAAPTGLSWTVPDLYAQGINEAGMVYGKLWDTPNTTCRGVRWDAAGTGTLLEATAVNGAAIDETEQEMTDMNLAGTVVGWSVESGGFDTLGVYAVKWEAGAGTPIVLDALETTTGGYSYSAAYTINDSGMIGGESADFDLSGNETQNAVVWMPDGTIVNLNTLPIAHVNGASGSWRLAQVNTMAADGWAAGIGLYDADGSGTVHDWVSMNWSAQLGFGGRVVVAPGGGAMRWGDGRNWSSGTPALEIGRAIFSHPGLRQMFLDRIVRTQGVDIEAGETSLDVGGHELSVDERIRIFNGARLNLRTTYDLGNELVGHVFAHILNEGTFSPGNSPGLLNLIGDFDNAGVMEFEITGTGERQFDELWIDGAFEAGGTLRLVLDGYTPVLGDEFDLFDWETLDWQGLTFDFTAAPLTTGLGWDTSSFQSSGILRVGSAIPEPAGLAMALGIAAGITFRRRPKS